MGDEPNYDAEMALPAGKTCADCVHVRRCVSFGYTLDYAAECDFWPSRYRPSPTLPEGGA